MVQDDVAIEILEQGCDSVLDEAQQVVVFLYFLMHQNGDAVVVGYFEFFIEFIFADVFWRVKCDIFELGLVPLELTRVGFIDGHVGALGAVQLAGLCLVKCERLSKEVKAFCFSLCSLCIDMNAKDLWSVN